MLWRRVSQLVNIASLVVVSGICSAQEMGATGEARLR